MGRPRFQRGYITASGENWRGEYYETVFTPDGQRRIHRSITLGQRAKLSKTEAKRKLQEHLARYQRVLPDAGVSLRWFIESKFLPIKEAKWKASTKGTSLGILKKQIIEPLGSFTIGELDRPSLQAHLNFLAEKGYSHSIVQHSASFLKNIFDLAEELEFISRSPARRLELPRTRQFRTLTPENGQYTGKPYLSQEELRKLLSFLEGRNRLIVMLASLCAMRPSEIFALSWSSYQDGQLYIMERVYRGHFDTPKTPASMAPIPVPRVVREALEKWRKVCPDGQLIFPSKTGRTPLDQYNFSNRVLKPYGFLAAHNMSFPVIFQMLRRTWATWAETYGASPKILQCVLRHESSVSFTVETYQQGIRERILEVMDKFADAITAGLPEEAQDAIPVESEEQAASSFTRVIIPVEPKEKATGFLPRPTTKNLIQSVSTSKQNAEVAELADAPA